MRRRDSRSRPVDVDTGSTLGDRVHTEGGVLRELPELPSAPRVEVDIEDAQRSIRHHMVSKRLTLTGAER